MLIRNLGVLAVSTALLGTAACDKPGAAEQQKENEAVQVNQQSQQSAAEQAASAQANMRDKIGTAQADFQKTRDDYSRDRQQDLKDVDDRIAKLEQRAQTATGGTHAHLEQSLATVRAERAAFASDVRAIGNVAAPDWDQFKTRVDDAYDHLKTNLDKAS